MDASFRRLQRGEIFGVQAVPFMQGYLSVELTDSWGEYRGGFVEMRVREIEVDSKTLKIWKYNEDYIYVLYDYKAVARGG